MKSSLLSWLLILLVLPLAANAEIKRDMADPSMSLASVAQLALGEGMRVGDVVAQMIKADPSQAASIVATALILRPNDYQAVIDAAIDAGANPSAVVAAALIAVDGENAEKIIQAVVSASPGTARASIVQAAANTLPSTTKGVQAIAAVRLTAGKLALSGGGAGNTTNDFVELLTLIDDIEQSLLDAGLNPDDVEASVTALEDEITEANADLDLALTSLAVLQDELEAAEVAQAAALVAVADAQEAAVAAATAQAELAAAQEAAADAELAAQEAELALAILETEKAAVVAANTIIEADLAEAAATIAIVTQAATDAQAAVAESQAVIDAAIVAAEGQTALDEAALASAEVSTAAALQAAEQAQTDAEDAVELAADAVTAAEAAVAALPVQTEEAADALVEAAAAEVLAATEAAEAEEALANQAELELAAAIAALNAAGGSSPFGFNPLELTAAELQASVAAAQLKYDSAIAALQAALLFQTGRKNDFSEAQTVKTDVASTLAALTGANQQSDASVAAANTAVQSVHSIQTTIALLTNVRNNLLTLDTLLVDDDNNGIADVQDSVVATVGDLETVQGNLADNTETLDLFLTGLGDPNDYNDDIVNAQGNKDNADLNNNNKSGDLSQKKTDAGNLLVQAAVLDQEADEAVEDADVGDIISGIDDIIASVSGDAPTS